MIDPGQVRRKAEQLYPKFLEAWLAGDPFFPRYIRANLKVGSSPAEARAAVRKLRDGSKEVHGFGYTIEWTDRNSRVHGRNRFPRRIQFETQADFLRFVGKQAEFETFSRAVERVRAAQPRLEPWLRSHRKALIDVAGSVDGLLHVVEYLEEHPRPQKFARELPLPVDTKFIERHSRVLREWLDILLPPHTIRADESHFERRFGLRYAEPHILVRFLDATLQRDAGVPWPECSIPLQTLAKVDVPAERALVVENKVPLLTLPPTSRTVGLGGLGNAVTELRHVPWLHDIQVWYWGDLDVEGFEILSRLRAAFPNTRSLFMDDETRVLWAELGQPGKNRSRTCPAGLTAGEQAAFAHCAGNNFRIEQEHLPHSYVVETLARLLQ